MLVFFLVVVFLARPYTLIVLIDSVPIVSMLDTGTSKAREENNVSFFLARPYILIGLIDSVPTQHPTLEYHKYVRHRNIEAREENNVSFFKLVFFLARPYTLIVLIDFVPRLHRTLEYHNFVRHRNYKDERRK